MFVLAIVVPIAMAPNVLAAAIDLSTDEYLCYQAKPSRLSGVTFAGVEFSTKDQFEAAPRRNWRAAKLASVCNPITTPASQGSKPEVHLIELPIKESQLHPNPTKFAPPISVYNLADRLGGLAPLVVARPKSVMTRVALNDYGEVVRCSSSLDCIANPPATACHPGARVCAIPGTPLPSPLANLGGTSDYTCYSIRGAVASYPNALSPPDDIVDAFGFAQQYGLTRISKICAPADNDGPGLAGPDAPNAPGHLVCYRARSLATNPDRFPRHLFAVQGSLTGGQYLEATKQTEICIPALKALHPAEPSLTTPTRLTTISREASGQCGELVTNFVGQGVPNRRDPVAASLDPNAACTGPSSPKPCCYGAHPNFNNHCDERNTVVCGGTTLGGGGPGVGKPGVETVERAGVRRRYELSCAGPTDTACAISGSAGDPATGVQCTSVGCGAATPVESTSPWKTCTYSTVAAQPSGTLNLADGSISLTRTVKTDDHVLTATSFVDTACPRCRTTTSTSSAAVFATGGTAGSGVCDDDALNPGATCRSFEPAGATAGLTTDCTPDASGGATTTRTYGLTATTGGAAMTHPQGHFCPGQGGNVDCTGSGSPQVCCTRVGMGWCSNFNGCFGSGKYADAFATCTGISVAGLSNGPLYAGYTMEGQAYGGVACVPPAIGGVVVAALVNNGAGLPGPIVAVDFADFRLD